MPDAVTSTDRALVLGAFDEVSERARAVLWHVLIDHDPPDHVAVTLGASEDEIAALLQSAHAELRAALVRGYGAVAPGDHCRRLLALVAARAARRTAAVGAETALDAHLATCGHCAGAQRWINDVASLMEAVVLPSVLGTEAAERYLAERGE